ncbi:class F sortase [Glaciibacter psychrotolerans]|uniref:Class F sortase n=1 Tax=Glaciibacter psychrotolerans TaxID=670054 RepID=A0A7Z0EDV9_9MICO|nr:class F sortase [Leifsonia psychrotolerans]NYJ19405.1 hypothetical protein [Leifsonia psychrotolerans]
MNAATRIFGLLVAAFAVLVTSVGCAGAPTKTSSDAQQPAQAPSASAAVPSSPPTAQVDVPRVNAGIDSQQPEAVPPVRLRIDALDVDMTVQPVGLAETGAMALPENPADAAWYRYGAWPGSDSGSVVIAAHVDSLRYDLGPLARLPLATPGTEVVVTTTDGTDVIYEVAQEGLVIKNDVPWSSVFDRTGAPRLTIVTCGGEFDYERLTYLSNVIVTALPRM